MELMQPDSIFVDEALANLDVMAQGLSDLSSGVTVDVERIDAIFRCAHSVKGGAAAFGLVDLSGLMHQAESVLNRWRQTRLAPDADSAGLLHEAVSLARQCLQAESPQRSAILSLTERLRALADDPAPGPASRHVCVRISGGQPLAIAQAVAHLFRDIDGLGTVLRTAGGGAAPWIFDIRTPSSDAELVDLLAMHVDRTHIRLQAVQAGAPAQSAPAAATVASAAPLSSVRVALAELDLLDRLVAKLSVLSDGLAGPRVASTMPAGAGPDIGAAGRLAEIAAELRQALQDIRSAPASVLFALVPPLLADLSPALGKPFRLALSGESVRLDRSLIQGLADPLIQLVRNSCDHGIESLAERRQAGKLPQGLVEVSATAHDGVVELAVRDDGRGFSRAKLLQAARARGIDLADDLPDAALWPLVFAPGLSTASGVSPVSGRGVGMDVVRSKVAALGGRIEMDSTAGVGTCITIRLPAAGRAGPG